MKSSLKNPLVFLTSFEFTLDSKPTMFGRHTQVGSKERSYLGSHVVFSFCRANSTLDLGLENCGWAGPRSPVPPCFMLGEPGGRSCVDVADLSSLISLLEAPCTGEAVLPRWEEWHAGGAGWPALLGAIYTRNPCAGSWTVFPRIACNFPYD